MATSRGEVFSDRREARSTITAGRCGRNGPTRRNSFWRASGTRSVWAISGGFLTSVTKAVEVRVSPWTPDSCRKCQSIFYSLSIVPRFIILIKTGDIYETLQCTPRCIESIINEKKMGFRCVSCAIYLSVNCMRHSVDVHGTCYWPVDEAWANWRAGEAVSHYEG